MKTSIKAIGRNGVNNLELVQIGTYGCDLHHELYNVDYFIIGTYKAKTFLNTYGVFEAIGKITKYENDNFGEVNTDLTNPEKVANMLAYIIGEELLQDCPTLHKKWDDRLRKLDLNKIKRELKMAIKSRVNAI